MSNVNFWNETMTLYINGVLCAFRKETVLARGYQEDFERLYKKPIDDEAHRVLTDVFDLIYDKTIFKHKPFYTAGYLSDRTTRDWKHVACHRGKLFEDDIDTVRVKFEYSVCGKNISMKELFEYPAYLVVEYLKERGITSCPINME